MKTYRQRLGELGEDHVTEHYIRRGALIRQRNVSFPVGEIDLIVEEPDGTVVFVEVKTRSGPAFGVVESVTPRKLGRMRRAAAAWLRLRPYVPVRFDVVAVTIDPLTGATTLTTFEGVEQGAR
ncbi:YraN family protein [Corynebacterium pacaense]|uniref:YraN family protein n=1 Tax=Corynebacterium pacaense TaxID=1816684 RepID=UPI0009B95650|nr:YraN family protein [Corynebacterium pacaense]